MNKVILFSSPTCGPCKQLKAALKQMDLEVDQEVNILDGDYLDLVMSSGVRGVPTLMLMNSEGQRIDVETGFSGDLERLKTFFKHKAEEDSNETKH